MRKMQSRHESFATSSWPEKEGNNEFGNNREHLITLITSGYYIWDFLA